LFVSVLLGVSIFGESLSSGGGHLASAILGLLVAVGGISFLASEEAPETSAPVLENPH
jgi:hypothetical protein